MFEKINNVNMRFLVLSVYKVQNRLLMWLLWQPAALQCT